MTITIPHGMNQLYQELGQKLDKYKLQYPDIFKTCFTPIISFGDLINARVLTVGINPSHQEFCEQNGCELPLNRRRFTHSSGNIYDESQIESQFHYFSMNPYKRWFNPVNDLLRTLGASYYCSDNDFISAAHTDIRSPFPTKPSWGKLPKIVQGELSEESGLYWWHRLMRFAKEARIVFLFCKCDLLTKHLPNVELLTYKKGRATFKLNESKLNIEGRELVLLHTTDYRGVTPGNTGQIIRDKIKLLLSQYRSLVQKS